MGNAKIFSALLAIFALIGCGGSEPVEPMEGPNDCVLTEGSSWVSQDLETCASIRFQCDPGLAPFSNDCGCGCEKLEGCVSDDECGGSEFCKLPAGACGETNHIGECVSIGDGYCTRDYRPVCGCNGVTYSNECNANAAGANIVHEGRCEEEIRDECEVDADCPTIYCITTPCPQNVCIAGQCQIADIDECDPLVEDCGNEDQACGGFLGGRCGEGEFCSYRPEDICGAADATGVCREIPHFCPQHYQPVCGCDGRTFGNACMAANHGISVVSEGPCEE